MRWGAVASAEAPFPGCVRGRIDALRSARVDTIDALRAQGDERIEVYAWPLDKRPTGSDGGRGILHVKCAVADDDVLLVSSANLTRYSLELNMDLGLLVTHGEAPRRVKEHFDKLVLRGVLKRIP